MNPASPSMYHTTIIAMGLVFQIMQDLYHRQQEFDVESRSTTRRVGFADVHFGACARRPDPAENLAKMLLLPLGGPGYLSYVQFAAVLCLSEVPADIWLISTLTKQI